MKSIIFSREINMERLKYLVIGILALFLAGCGSGKVVVETLNVAEGPTSNAPGSGKNIVILPFADYSQGNLESAQRRNMLITESLTDRLIVNGFGLPIQEDVIDYLIKNNVINVSTSSMAVELTNDWSETMKSEIRSYMNQVQNEASQMEGNSFGTHGLDSQTVAKIGRQFNADYIVRGRILEFKTRRGTSWAPPRRGFFPVVFESTGRAVFGYVSSDSYDDRDGSLSEMESGGLTHGQGPVDGEGAVQMRMWVQEAATGNVVWSNRISVQVSPESVLADNQYDTLFNTAIEKGVTTLVDHFVTYGL
jgi:TolB-like protein